MYLPYVMSGYVAAVLLMIAGCRVSEASVSGLRGIRLLRWGYIIGLLGVILMACRAFMPAWASVIVSNEAIFAFPLFFYGATAKILDTPARLLRWGMGLMALSIPAFSYWTLVRPNLTARILLASAFPGICAAVTAAMLLRYREGCREAGPVKFVPLARALGWLQILLATQHVARIGLTLVFPPEQILHLDMIQAGYSYTNMMITVGAGCGLIWLSLYMQRTDLQARAQTDGLTGLLNRRAFEELLTREVARSSQQRQPLSLLLMDIDRFKQVNDVWGHQAGDEVIRRVSRALREGTRPSDAVSRFGGEEFVVMLRDTAVDQAEEIAERLRCAVAGMTGMPSDGPVTMSFGVAASWLGNTPSDLLRRCDEALYQSKRDGRNRVSVARDGSGNEGAPFSALSLEHGLLPTATGVQKPMML